MKKTMLVALLIFSCGAGAMTMEDGVHAIVRGNAGEPHLVKFNSGAVKFVSEDKELAVYEAKLNASKSSEENFEKVLLQEDPAYEPTAVDDSQLTAIWNRMNMFIKRKSECSDRAHVWTYDEFAKTGIKSEKAFLLLTDSYIRRNNYKWWFHVAPMYTTKSGKKMVMDGQFLDHPVTFNEWKNHLVFSGRECVTDFSFNAYDAGADQTQDCYTKHEPMYYYIPQDSGAFENGRGKTGWSMGEVNGARSRAFFKGSAQ